MSDGDGGGDGFVGLADRDGDEGERVLREVEAGTLGGLRVGGGRAAELLQRVVALAARLLRVAAARRALDRVEDAVGAPLQVGGPLRVGGGELVGRALGERGV